MKPTDLMNWHQRLGHVDVRMIEKMARKKLVEGLNITNRELKGLCEDCVVSKATKHPFDTEVIHEVDPLERIHIDLWGPAQTPSWGKAIYMMLACDSGTSIAFPIFLTRKDADTTTNEFKTFHKTAENQTGKKLHCVRFDMGSEFDNQTFARYCEEHGITMEKVPKASSAANGHVERMNRTIIEGVRTMLLDAKMDRR
jgi:hypothetical protein